MGVAIGPSMLAIAVGAILRFAVSASVAGIEIGTVGIILMVVGVVGLGISLWLIVIGSGEGGEST